MSFTVTPGAAKRPQSPRYQCRRPIVDHGTAATAPGLFTVDAAKGIEYAPLRRHWCHEAAVRRRHDGPGHHRYAGRPERDTPVVTWTTDEPSSSHVGLRHEPRTLAHLFSLVAGQDDEFTA